MNLLDRTVATMMSRYGMQGYVSVAILEAYDTETSENIISYQDYQVNILVFDYVRKQEGVGTEKDTLVQTGDKQVYVQPPQKTDTGIPLPHLSPNKDLLKVGDKTYKIVTVKQYNPSMSSEGCVVYELYVRE